MTTPVDLNSPATRGDLARLAQVVSLLSLALRTESVAVRMPEDENRKELEKSFRDMAKTSFDGATSLLRDLTGADPKA